MIVEILLTFFCAASCCCGAWADGITFTGVRAVKDWTLACDPETFPMGTILDIEGLGERMCQDIGGAIKGAHVDVFVGHDKGAHKRALKLGRRENVRARVVHVGGERG